MTMQRTIKCTENGKTFRCSTCNKIHIQFKNLNFTFSDKEYKSFVDYISNLYHEYWEYKTQEPNHKRKIVLHIGHRNVNILLNYNELQELNQLFNNTYQGADQNTVFGIKDMDITLFLN